MIVRLMTIAALLLVAAPAFAFVRTATCAARCHQVCEVNGICEDGGEGASALACAIGQDCADCGLRPDPTPSAPRCPSEMQDGQRVYLEQPMPITWPTCEVDYVINDRGYSGEPDLNRIVATIQGSFDAWNRVEGAGFAARFAGVTDRRVTLINDQNLIMFLEADTCLMNTDGVELCGWNQRAGYAPAALALASVSFAPVNGEIVDVDIEVNAANWPFEIICGEPSGQTHDLQNTLTHEIGHLAGLDHCHADALTGEVSCETVTMRAQTTLGDRTMRDLSLDDEAGLRAIYPANSCSNAAAITYEFPLEGAGCGAVEDFEVTEDEEPPQARGCCTTATHSPLSPNVMVLSLLVVALRRRRWSSEQ